ncbi:vitamin K epoxide reductase complex subunit 1 isoform X2 [Hyposmocoma kahamanoa]|nr:vitamin K epoxide reductase complex subunit 1 isoform X2 [Hyposmocoma kahamanoa]
MLKGNQRSIVAAAIAGILISTYALYVEMAAEVRPGYKALCDISEHASCSRVLTSKYSKGFGLISDDSLLVVPNCVYGVIFYCLMIFLSTFDNLTLVRVQFFIALSSVATCFYLAYLLIFVLKDFCIVCVSTYVFNAAIVYFLNKKIQILKVKAK